MTQILLDLKTPESWPEELSSHLEQHRDLFIDWETGQHRFHHTLYDRAIYELMDLLNPYAMRGWHCTRLTNAEIDAITLNGMQLPNTKMLTRRIDACVIDGLIDKEVARHLKAKNQSSDANSVAKIWFCFYPPHRAGELGIGRFFRHWGGEALYNFHENDPVTSPAIAGIGTPCVIEADVPLDFLGHKSSLAGKIAEQYVRTLGYHTNHSDFDHDDFSTSPLSPAAIKSIVRFPDRDFLLLTGSASWRIPLKR